MTMSSLEIGLGLMCVIFASAVLGMLAGQRLPAHHVSTESKATVSVAMAVVGTMTALVIGFMISNASSSFTAKNGAVARLSSDIVRLDALLRRYGPEADTTRTALQHYAAAKLEDLFPNGDGRKPDVANPATLKLLDDVQDRIVLFKPADDRQRWLGGQALQLAGELGDAGAGVIQQDVSSLPLPFLGAVTIWLVVVFASFGVFAPRNATTIIALFLCAFAVSAAIKLVMDLDTPFEGDIRITRPPIHISSDPLRQAADTIRR